MSVSALNRAKYFLDAHGRAALLAPDSSLFSTLAITFAPTMIALTDTQALAITHAVRQLHEHERTAFLTALKALLAGRDEVGDGELGRARACAAAAGALPAADRRRDRHGENAIMQPP